MTELDGDDTYPLSDIVFQCAFFMKNPYIESVTDVTRTKTITTNNQEWYADDDSRDIKTEGNVDAVPVIQVTNNAVLMSGYTTYDAPGTFPHGLAWDGSNIWSCDVTTDKIYKHNSDLTVNTTYDAPGTFPSGLTWDGSNIWSCDEDTDKIYMHNSDLTVNTTYDAPGTFPSGLTWDGSNIWSCDYNADKIYIHSNGHLKNISVYNTADTTTKCLITNEMSGGAVYTINTDGTGTINYSDNFTTIKWKGDSTIYRITHDEVNDELDIADDGYIYWKCDCKYPVTGVPTSTSHINITSGTPTIQISSDAATWYDIDTSIIDDVDTEYPLDSDGNLSLAGETLFYFRLDCVKAATATCSIKSFELDVNIHTIYAKNPVINRGGTASTFRCDQDSDSGMNCEVELIYPARWWA